MSHSQPASLSSQHRLDQLDDWSLLGIFDFLDYDEIINLAQASERFHQVILQRYMIPVFHIDEKLIHIGGFVNSLGMLEPSTIFPFLRLAT